jgi:hypothetical protein
MLFRLLLSVSVFALVVIASSLMTYYALALQL